MAPTQLDIIRIRPGQMQASLNLRATSALQDCTMVDGDDGGVFVTRRWPSLSTGEELLWSVLAWLNGQGELPANIAGHLDMQNAAAVQAAVNVGLGVAS